MATLEIRGQAATSAILAEQSPSAEQQGGFGTLVHSLFADADTGAEESEFELPPRSGTLRAAEFE